MKSKGRKKYVYTHSHNGTVFYVGCGVSNRPKSKSRTDKWHDHIDSIGGSYEVNIISSHTSKKRALAVERRLIKALRPKCNYQHNVIKIKTKAVVVHIGFEAKTVFESLTGGNFNRWANEVIIDFKKKPHDYIPQNFRDEFVTRHVLSIPVKEHKKIKRAADNDCRSVSSWCVIALWRALENNLIDQGIIK